MTISPELEREKYYFLIQMNNKKQWKEATQRTLTGRKEGKC